MTVNTSALDAAPKVGTRGLSLQASSILAGVSSGGHGVRRMHRTTMPTASD
jgi:hypothetical protein